MFSFPLLEVATFLLLGLVYMCRFRSIRARKFYLRALKQPRRGNVISLTRDVHLPVNGYRNASSFNNTLLWREAHDHSSNYLTSSVPQTGVRLFLYTDPPALEK
jgi:hypothetical protein